MTVGSAEQFISSVTTEDKVPYNFRPSGGSTDIGNRETDMVVGGTIAWNQLVGSATSTVTIANGYKYIACIGGTWSFGNSTGTAIAVAGGTDGDSLVGGPLYGVGIVPSGRNV